MINRSHHITLRRRRRRRKRLETRMVSLYFRFFKTAVTFIYKLRLNRLRASNTTNTSSTRHQAPRRVTTSPPLRQTRRRRTRHHHPSSRNDSHSPPQLSLRKRWTTTGQRHNDNGEREQQQRGNELSQAHHQYRPPRRVAISPRRPVTTNEHTSTRPTTGKKVRETDDVSWATGNSFFFLISFLFTNSLFRYNLFITTTRGWGGSRVQTTVYAVVWTVGILFFWFLSFNKQMFF
jgi:hypothetical protein